MELMDVASLKRILDAERNAVKIDHLMTLTSMGLGGAILVQNTWSLASPHLEKLRDAFIAEPACSAGTRRRHQL